ncbi:hypothetical protein PENTCL1PPCAC_13956 [Pristionchus entomophagus]|uniref:Major facilitator superfamily (MFS) profile domain-containing protein n=1 Tax=Pristionchus entomophagus TaxID=358040 RepID=A0AAV5T873_9BILA|nr:hypothetical protein PENTCL1PPCAC_13956 [Pristionchus entomophagus]
MNSSVAETPSSLPLLPPGNDDSPPTCELVEKPDAKAEETKKNVDSFLRLSWYCARILFLSQFILFGSAANMIFLVYAGAAPQSVVCVGDEINISDICKLPLEERTRLNCSLMPVYEFHSLNVEFEYFCEEVAHVKGAISFQMAGLLFGTLFWGYFADAKGRRLALIICFTVLTFLSVTSSFVHSFFMFQIILTLQSFFTGGALIVYGVYMMEHLPHSHRFLISSLIAWSPNYILFTLLAWLTGDWRTLQLVIVVVSLPAFPAFFFVYESPRWLIQRGRIDEARVVLERMQAIDGVSQTKKEDMQKMIEEEHEKVLARERKSKNYNITHIFRHRNMAIVTMIISLGVLLTSMISFGLMFNLEKLSGSLFLNSIYLGLLRWSLNIATGIFDFKIKWASRKLVHTIGQGVVALGLVLLTWTYFNGKSVGLADVVRVSTLLSAAFVSQTQISKGMMALEYFPTVVRNSAASFKTVCSRIGAVLAPHIFLLPIPWMPYALLAALTLADTVAVLFFIPETKGRPLPENMPEKKKKNVTESSIIAQFQKV